MQVDQHQCLVCSKPAVSIDGLRIGSNMVKLPFCTSHQVEAAELISCLRVGVAVQQACYEEAKRRSKAVSTSQVGTTNLRVIHE